MSVKGNVSKKLKAGTVSQSVTLALIEAAEEIPAIKGRVDKANEDLAAHKRDKNNSHEVTKGQVGLGNVDNTSDLSKPISSAAQAAFNGKADKEHIHNGKDIANGTITKEKLAFDASDGSGGSGISVDGRSLFGTVFIDVVDGVPYLREGGSGEYLLHVSFEGIPYARMRPGSSDATFVSVNGKALYGTTYVDVVNGAPYLQDDGSGEYLLYVNYWDIPYIKS